MEPTFGKFDVVTPGLGAATNLQWGPDGLLYVTTLNGLVHALEVTRTTKEEDGETVTDFYTGTIVWTHDLNTPNFDDFGNLVDSNARQALGIVVTEDEVTGETVVYASHSDNKIGAGTGGGDGDLDLDTNSGVITRITVDSSGDTPQTTEAIDLIRGLPRSEENHATNGLGLTTDGDGNPILLIASGGNTNAGSPSTNFVGLPEYTYAGAMLSADLNQLAEIEAYRKSVDPDIDYVFDLPTLDDPTRFNYKDAQGNDVWIDNNFDGVVDTVAEYVGPELSQAANDSFVGANIVDSNNDGVLDTILGDSDDNVTGVRGGNDGLNQTKLLVNNPVQIYAPGYRNIYDVVVTEDGQILTYDNSWNTGWGAAPVLVDENGNPILDEDGEFQTQSDEVDVAPPITNIPHTSQGILENYNQLHFVEEGVHAGHPNPLHAAGAAAGWWTSPEDENGTPDQDDDTLLPGNQLSDTPLTTGGQDDGLVLPADWDQVVDAELINPEAGDFREGGIYDGAVDADIGSWNGLAEYTGTALGEEFAGSILVSKTSGEIKLIQRNELGGIDVVDQEGGTFDGDGDVVAAENQWIIGDTGKGNSLGIDTVGDFGVDGQFGGQFNNTIWVSSLGGGGQKITVFEAGGTPTPPSDNIDLDSFNNAVDVFDLSSTQGVGHVFTQAGATNTLAAGETLFYDLSPTTVFENSLGQIGILGMMINGSSKAFVESLPSSGAPDDGLISFDANVILGGAGSALQVKDYFSGTAKGAANNQLDAYTFAADFDDTVVGFSIKSTLGSIVSPFYRDGSEAGIQMGAGNQQSYMSLVVAYTIDNGTPQASLEFYYEENDVEVTSQSVDISAFLVDGILPFTTTFDLEFDVNALTGAVTPKASVDGQSIAGFTPVTATGDVLSAIQGDYEANGVPTALAFGNIGTTDLALGSGPADGNVTYSEFEVDAFGPDAFLSFSDVTLDEGAGTASITLSLVDAQGQLTTLGEAVEVDLGVGGTAIIDDDYTATIPTTETFAAGQSQKTYTFTLLDDSVSEGAETIDVSIDAIRSGTATVIATVGEETGTVTLSDDDAPIVEYRINAGGPEVFATDGGPNWLAGDGQGELTPGVSINFGSSIVGSSGPLTRDESLPDYVPDDVFFTERFDDPAPQEMKWTFDVETGSTYSVRLYMRNGFSGTSEADQRVFDVSIEDQVIFDDIDLSGDLGHLTGGMFEYVYTATDDQLEIEFLHDVIENPLINAIEILNIDAVTSTVSLTAVGDVVEAGDAGVTTLSFTLTSEAAQNVEATYSVSINGAVTSGLTTTVTPGANTITVDVPNDAVFNGAEVVSVTLDSLDVDASVATIGQSLATASVTEDDNGAGGEVLYRINAGGAEVAAIDGGPNWLAGTVTGNVQEGVTVNYGDIATLPATVLRYEGPTTDSGGQTLPDYVPDEIFLTERWDPIEGPEMLWTFDVETGAEYALRIYMRNGFSGTDEADERVFDIAVEQQLVFDDIDLSGELGHLTGGMFEHVFTAQDNLLEIEFLHDVIENPIVNGFEIVELTPPPSGAPTAVDDDGFSTPTEQTVFIRFEDLLSNDIDDNPSELKIVGFDNPHPTIAGGFFSDNGALFTLWSDTGEVTDIAQATQILYGPPPAAQGENGPIAYTGEDTFTYTIEDEGGAASQSSAVVTVTTAPDVVEEPADVTDIVTGTEFSERAFGEFGDDSIQVFGGDDIVFGFVGDDDIFGGDGDDRLDGEWGADMLVGGAGIDYLYGDGFSGVDEFGVPIPQQPLGDESMDDILYGGEGLDALFGGVGNDTFALTSNSDEEQIFDWNEGDKIAVEGASSLNDLTITTDEGTNNVRVILNGTDGSDSMLIVSATPIPALDADDFDFEFDFSQLEAPLVA